MKKVISILFVIIISIVLAHYSSTYFGEIYSELPQVWSGGWIGSDSSWNSLIGLPLALVFFITLLSYRFVLESKKSVLILIAPVFIFEIIFDFSHIYLPVVLVIIAFVINSLCYKFVSKIRS